jgi:ubiquinone/menaquinone biosynthesis C-methylase UbiE
MTLGGEDPSQSRWRSYRAVDAADDPRSLSAQLDQIASIPAVAAEKQRSLELLGLGPGGRVLDVGCGNGAELEALATIVGPGGRVVVLDRSTALIGAAEARGLGRLAPIELLAADATSLPFPDVEFDACRADRTLQHLDRPEAALAEMARVTRPGGRVVVTESRWGLVAPGLDRAVTNRVLGGMATEAERESWLGHRLVSMFGPAGVTDVEAISQDFTLDDIDQIAGFINLGWLAGAAVNAGTVSREDVEHWCERLGELVAQGEAFAMVLFLHVTGLRPG